MAGQTRPLNRRSAQLAALAVLVGIVLTSALVPLKPVMQQALVGIALVWLGIAAMLGFGF